LPGAGFRKLSRRDEHSCALNLSLPPERCMPPAPGHRPEQCSIKAAFQRAGSRKFKKHQAKLAKITNGDANVLSHAEALLPAIRASVASLAAGQQFFLEPSRADV